jgi:hypothetical protein
MVRAKFKCTSRQLSVEGEPYSAQIRLDAVTEGKGNESWSQWTPSGTLTMNVTNPDAVTQFQVGEEYFIDITPAAVIADGPAT